MRAGRTNNLELTKPSGGKLRLPGQGGMSDVANMHQNYVVYVPRHGKASLVETVEMVSSARGVISAADRERPATGRATPGSSPTSASSATTRRVGQLVVVETMPGVGATRSSRRPGSR